MSAGHLTIITATRPNTLGKRYALTDHGGLTKTTAGELLEGNYAIREFPDIEALAALLNGVGTHQALMASLPIDGSRAGRIVPRAELRNNPGALARTKEHFGFPINVPGVIVLDYDPVPGTAPMTREQLWALLVKAVPAVTESGAIWWASGSSYIHHGGSELQGLRGQRIYLLTRDLSDTPRFGEALAQRLWLAGHGRVQISSSGQKLMRHVFDDAMSQPARLDFCGGAVCDPPLEQRRGAPVILSCGGFLDTQAALPALSREEAQRYEALLAEAREKAGPEARAARERWKVSRSQAMVSTLIGAGQASMEAHERTDRALSAALSGVLLGDFEIVLEGGRRVSIGQVLDDRERYHGTLCLDPLEPEYLGGKVVGKLYLFGASPTLHSFAHGGATYQLRRQPARLYTQTGRQAELAEEVHAFLANEPDVFTRGGVLVRIVDGRLRLLRKAGLRHLVGTRCALFARDDKGRDVPRDLPADVADMVLSLVEG